MTSNNNRFVRTLGGSLLPAGRTTENEFGTDVTVSTSAAVPVLPSDLPLESPTIDDDDDDLMPKLSKNKKKKLPPPPPKKAPPPLLKRSSSAISNTTTASNESDVKDNDKNTVYLDDQEEDDVCDFFDHSRKLLQKRRKKKNPKSGSEKIEPAIENNSDSRPKDIGNVDLKEAAKILLSGSESDVDDDDLTFRHYEQPSWSASNANGPVLVDSDSDSNSDVDTSEIQPKEIPVNVVERRKSLTPPPPEIFSTAPLLLLYNPSLNRDRNSNIDLDLDPTFNLHAPSSQSNIELLPELQSIANHAVSNTPSQNKRKRTDGSTAGYNDNQMTGQPVDANQRSELSEEDKRRLILKLTVVTMPGQELSGEDLHRWHQLYRTIMFNYSYNAPFTALFENYKQRFSVSEPIFTFNSLRIYSFATPESIGMADPKRIDWFIKAKESGYEELKRPGSQLIVGETTIRMLIFSII
ncbi:hypothetical protein BKA69DRAFT_59254 [Paraphysoderma sedebokerense]|nr:hypothetical protein BKA69DRAFT_59254 [Paraphysoderma sedebokerense]